MIPYVAVVIFVCALVLCCGIFSAAGESVRSRVGGVFLVLFLGYVLIGIALALLTPHLPRDDSGGYTPREFVR